jgi:hypothetical protein
MKLTIKKLKQLIKEELQKESTMHDGPRAEPASDADAALRAVNTADVVIDGVIKRLEKGGAPGVFAVAASGPLRDVVKRPVDGALIDNVIVPFRDYLYSLEKLDKKVAAAPDPKQALADAGDVNAKLLSQKWGQLVSAMLGLDVAREWQKAKQSSRVVEGKLTKAEKTEKKKLKAKKKLTKQDKDRLDTIQHK